MDGMDTLLAKITEATNRFLEGLDQEQAARTLLPFGNEEERRR